MNKPFDLFESIQLDARQKEGRSTQAALPSPSADPGTSEMVVSQALAAQLVPAALDKELALVHLATDQASALKAEAMALVGSEPFLREASKEIGAPKVGESEDEFVSRAKATLRALLTKSLKG